jgi:hypothetical protein
MPGAIRPSSVETSKPVTGGSRPVCVRGWLMFGDIFSNYFDVVKIYFCHMSNIFCHNKTIDKEAL